MSKLNLSLFLTVLVVGYGLTHILFSQIPEQGAPAAVPSFAFTDLKGQVHRLEDFKGRNVVLNFWATWCAPCIKEFPLLLEIAQENKNVVLIALSSDLEDEAIEKFLVKYKYRNLGDNVYIARDTEGATGAVFGTYKLPETLVLDVQGRLQHKFIGANWSKEDMLQTLKVE